MARNQDGKNDNEYLHTENVNADLIPEPDLWMINLKKKTFRFSLNGKNKR